MKRKILSLALALMMIVSVAAALPVAAVENGTTYELDMNKSVSGWTTTGNVFPNANSISNIADLPSWVTSDGFAMYRGETQTVAQNITVAEGNAGLYEVSVAYSNVLENSAIWVTLTADGKPFDRKKFEITTTGGYGTSAERVASLATANIATIKTYLPEGTISVNFSTTVPTVSEHGDGTAWGDALPLWMFGAHIEAAESYEDFYAVVAADDFYTGKGGGSGNMGSNPKDDFGWVPGKAGFLFHTNTKDDVTYRVYVPVAGYYNMYLAGGKYSNAGVYSLYVNGAETPHRTDVVISVGSTEMVDVQVSPAVSTKLNAGMNTIRLKSTFSAKGDYFFGFKLAYAGQNLEEIYLNPTAGVKSNANYIFGVGKTCTYDGMTWGAGNGGIYHYNNYTSSTSYTLNFDESEAGVYAVDVAVGNTSTTTTGSATVGDSTTGKKTIVKTGARTTVKEMCLGNVVIPAGTNTIKVEFTVKTAHMNLYDIRLRRLHQYDVTAIASPAEGGTVTSATGIVKGESATITATPAAGYKIEGWYNENGEKLGNSKILTIDNVQADVSYTAKFVYGALIELEEHIKAGGPTINLAAASGGKIGGTDWNAVQDNPSFTTPISVKQSGYYVIEYVVNEADKYVSPITFTLNDGTNDDVLGNNAEKKAVEKMNYNYHGTVNTYGPLSKYKASRYLTAGDYNLTVDIALCLLNGDGSDKQGYKFQADYIDFKFIDESYLIDPNLMTKKNASNYYTTGSATTNNSEWPLPNGLSFCGMYSNVGLSYVVNPPETGWYSMTAAYGTPESDVDLMIHFDEYSQVWRKILPTTGSNAKLAETDMGAVYLEKGKEYNLTFYVYSAQRNSTGSWGMNFYGIRLEKTSNLPTELVINGALPIEGSSYTEQSLLSYAPADSSVSWANKGSIRINGAGACGKYNVYVPSAGYYTVNIASGTYSGRTPLVSLSVNGATKVSRIYLNAPLSNLSNNLLDIAETVIARVYLEAGENIIQINGVQDSQVQRLFNIKLEKEELPTAYDVRITDADDKDLSTIAGGSRIFAEVALPSDATGAEIFLAQYAGSGADKTLVKTSRVGKANTALYSVEGLNFCRTSLITEDVAGSVKAFLWTTDGEYIPLAAFDVAEVK